MGKTDRQTRDENGNLKGSGKTTHWAFTAYENQWPLFEVKIPGITWTGWQPEECPDTGRKHYQGALISREQHRWSGCKGDYKVGKTLTQQLPGVHIEPASNWAKLLQYCKKEETRIPGSNFETRSNSIPDHFQYAEDCGKRIYDKFKNTLTKDQILIALEILIGEDIMSGKRYASWITTNPMWKVMWNKWAKQFVFSFSSIDAPQISQQEDSVTPQDGEASQVTDQEGRDGQVD